MHGTTIKVKKQANTVLLTEYIKGFNISTYNHLSFL